MVPLADVAAEVLGVERAELGLAAALVDHPGGGEVALPKADVAARIALDEAADLQPAPAGEGGADLAILVLQPGGRGRGDRRQ
ncbi:MAG: hypothetical protein R3B09_28125 [Nannocystaceae bacterium]